MLEELMIMNHLCKSSRHHYILKTTRPIKLCHSNSELLAQSKVSRLPCYFIVPLN